MIQKSGSFVSSLTFCLFYSLCWTLFSSATSSPFFIPSSSSILSPKLSSSYSHVTFFSSHLSSTTLSHLFSLKSPRLSYPVIPSPHLSIPLSPPHVPSATPLFSLTLLLPSSSESCSHLACWNTLVSPLLSQGRDQPQPISHMTECAVCQWCMYAARGGATDG